MNSHNKQLVSINSNIQPYFSKATGRLLIYKVCSLFKDQDIYARRQSWDRNYKGMPCGCLVAALVNLTFPENPCWVHDGMRQIAGLLGLYESYTTGLISGFDGSRNIVRYDCNVDNRWFKYGQEDGLKAWKILEKEDRPRIWPDNNGLMHVVS
jgi:hypothetical protein